MRNLVASRVPLGDLWFFVTALYGIHYLLRWFSTSKVATSPVLNAIEQAAPFWAWGVALIIPSAVGLVANRLRWWGTAVAAHGFCFAVFCGLLFGLIQGVVAARQMWGWELGIGYFMLINLHGLWAIIDVIRDRAREIVVRKDTGG